MLLILKEKAAEEFNLVSTGKSQPQVDRSTRTVLAKVFHVDTATEQRFGLSAYCLVEGDFRKSAIVQITGNVPLASLRTMADSDEIVSSGGLDSVHSSDIYGVSAAPGTFPRYLVPVTEFQHTSRQEVRLFLKVYEHVSTH